MLSEDFDPCQIVEAAGMSTAEIAGTTIGAVFGLAILVGVGAALYAYKKKYVLT